MINETVFEKFPVLESERLLFRAFALDDAIHIQRIRSNPEVLRFLDNEAHIQLETSRTFVENNLQSFREHQGIAWVICDKKSGVFMGDFSFWRIDKKNHRAEIGYTLLPDYWGNGYMQEAMTVLLDFGFRKLNLHSIEANINPDNENSRKLLLKLGFKKEAYFRENYYFNGKYLDSEIYSLLNTK